MATPYITAAATNDAAIHSLGETTSLEINVDIRVPPTGAIASIKPTDILPILNNANPTAMKAIQPINTHWVGK